MGVPLLLEVACWTVVWVLEGVFADAGEVRCCCGLLREERNGCHVRLHEVAIVQVSGIQSH